MNHNTSRQHHIEVLSLEYRSLYALVQFRMSSLERRIPLAGAAMTAVVASVVMLPPEARPVLLVGLPIGLLWYMRTTVNHARSLEDLLRQIDIIERRINALIGEDLLQFQSHHPSRGQAVGGRTGRESVLAVFLMSIVLLGACASLFLFDSHLSSAPKVAFGMYIVVIGLWLGLAFISLRRYRYRHTGPSKPDHRQP